MDFLVDAATSTLQGTLTVPEGPSTKTHHKGGHHHHGPTVSPLPVPKPRVPFPGQTYATEHISSVGQGALWAYFAMFFLGFCAIYLMAQRVERKLRLFHWISLVIVGCAMVSYLCMASGLGVSYVRSYKGSHHHASDSHLFRQVFWARYVDWAVTTPLLLLDLALLAGMPLTTTILVMLADEAMILTGLFSGLSQNGETSRWLFFGVSDAFFLYVLWTLVVSGRNAAKLQSSNVQRVYGGTMALTVLLWLGYPIVFALTEGKGIISPDAEVIIYGVLDVLAKIGFSFYLLLAHSHTEGDSVVISDFWVEPRGAARGYGAISQDD